MRERLISDLVCDLLGPRDGPRERIRNPLSEYITGVLAPRHRTAEAGGPEEEVPPSSEEGAISDVLPPDYEDEFEDQDVLFPSPHPALDPRALPSSMGLRFSLVRDEEGEPGIELCVTWARYRRESGDLYYRRHPRACILGPLFPPSEGKGGSSRTTLYLGENGQCSKEQAEISVHVLWKRDGRGFWHVGVYLVNELRFQTDKEGWTECHIFQPQIRVRVLRGCAVPLGSAYGRRAPEDEELDLIYRRRTGMARGYMCSAVWREVDPERPAEDLEVERLHPARPPFYWIDGEIVKERYGSAVRDKFAVPDFRTEFVPVYLVEMPELEWPSGSEPRPVFRAEELAEAWEEPSLRAAIEPLLDGYRKWVEELEKRVEEVPDVGRSAAGRIVEKCRKALERMNNGLKLLLEDEDARLAFCFANKAMDLQARWAGKEDGLVWYPYQLAFILTVLESLANPESRDRMTCDLLWVPTGAGKTEACLALAAFIMAYRRRKALRGRTGNKTGAGTSVISRYTLRLLTIQQFRRALRMITACEYLRVYGLRERVLEGRNVPVGWRPEKCPIKQDFIWGSVRFSIGLWVGGGVTPNRLSDIEDKPGAISILKGKKGEGEPAQVISCPACGAILSVPDTGLEKGQRYRIYLQLKGAETQTLKALLKDFSAKTLTSEIRVLSTYSGRPVLLLELTPNSDLVPKDVDEVWHEIQSYLSSRNLRIELQPIRASKPGYFLVQYPGPRGGSTETFEIFCPNPECPLNKSVLWMEGAPAECGTVDEGRRRGTRRGQPPSSQICELKIGNILGFPDGMVFRPVPPFCKLSIPSVPFRPEYSYISERIPVPALTVDEQVYHHPPSMLLATADKFARLPFEPRAAAIFGNVDRYHPHLGYYRDCCEQPPHDRQFTVSIPPFDPPELVIQDELHLIEGPLGSLVGLYELAVDTLCGGKLKYIALTATVRRGREHVQALYTRDLFVFPPPGLDADDRFFIRSREAHQLDRRRPGRLYAGVCSPGRGPHTPLVRIWARLLQTVGELAGSGEDVDPFWTLVGYFNSIRELAGARALYRQDIPERLKDLSGTPRDLPDDRCCELSGRTSSTSLPGILQMLERGYPQAPDALFTTSMFGTGVDVPRLSLMVVCGQPKTTAAYIQATGRVGRRHPGLVVTFYRATRPRDLSHYEFFFGYHRAMEKYVETLTAFPFSPGTLERAAGAVIVSILRNIRSPSVFWGSDSSATEIVRHRSAREVAELPEVFCRRCRNQPEGRRPVPEDVEYFIRALLDRWAQEARNISSRGEGLRYAEYPGTRYHVVLGDSRHRHAGRICIYSDVPQSLRDVEETLGFHTGGGGVRRSR
jgi:hypothetical protein